MRTRRFHLVALAGWLCLAGPASLGAQGQPRTVPPELAEVLTLAQGDLRAARPVEALRRLSGYRGSDHALRQLLIGHAHFQQGRDSPAGEAYRAALRMDPKLTEAALGLAQVRARQEKWAESAELLGRSLAVDSCQADWLALYAQVARRLNDGRLVAMLVARGVRRFPADARFRRLDLAASIDRGDRRAATEAVRWLLKAAPGDADLWQQRAYLADRAGEETDAIAALEASVLCDPNDLARHRRFVGALVAAGDWPTALRRGRGLHAGPLAKAAAADVALMDLLIRAADMGEQDKTLGEWLALVPDKARTRGMEIVLARRALRRGQAADARSALRRLIEAGRADADVLLWAGHLAEDARDYAQAETLYDQARKHKGASAALATLYLARLHLRRGRHQRAGQLLRAHLDAHVDDATARALLAVVDAAGKPAR